MCARFLRNARSTSHWHQQLLQPASTNASRRETVVALSAKTPQLLTHFLCILLAFCMSMLHFFTSVAVVAQRSESRACDVMVTLCATQRGLLGSCRRMRSNAVAQQQREETSDVTVDSMWCVYVVEDLR